jgi:hypothetical protein
MCQVQSPHVVVQCWPPCPPCCAVPRCNTACAATCHQPLHARPCFPIHSAMPPNQACMHCQVLLSCCTLPPTCARHGSLPPTTPSSHLLPPTVVVVMSTTCPACHATCTARPATMPVTSHPVCPRTHGGPRCTGHHGLSYSHQHTHSRMASGMVSNHTGTPSQQVHTRCHHSAQRTRVMSSARQQACQPRKSPTAVKSCPSSGWVGTNPRVPVCASAHATLCCHCLLAVCTALLAVTGHGFHCCRHSVRHWTPLLCTGPLSSVSQCCPVPSTTLRRYMSAVPRSEWCNLT